MEQVATSGESDGVLSGMFSGGEGVMEEVDFLFEFLSFAKALSFI